MAQIIGRTLKIRVAVIENPSTTTSVEVGDFTTRENAATRLRSREEDQALLAASSPSRETLFKRQTLLPGQKIIVPLELFFSFDDDDLDFAAWWLARIRGLPSRLAKRLHGSQYYFVPDGEERTLAKTLDSVEQAGSATSRLCYPGGHSLSIDKSTLKVMMNRSGEDLELEKQYIFGPSLSLDKIEIDSTEYTPHEFDPKKITIISKIAGSARCPYVFTYSMQGHTWINEGRILVGKNSAARDSFDSKHLDEFSGSVMIKELEAEHTFIDAI